MTRSKSQVPSNRYIPQASTWRMHWPLGERHHAVAVGEKNLNHNNTANIKTRQDTQKFWTDEHIL